MTDDSNQPQVGDKVLIGFHPFTNKPAYAEIIAINEDGSWETQYDEPTP